MIFTIVLVGFLLLACVTLFVVASAFLGFLITRVPFVPTYASDIKFIVEKLGITHKDIFYDLGSGNGKVVFLVENLTGCRVAGYELTWWTHLYAKLKGKIQKSNAQFKNRNFFTENWAGASIIYCYLYPSLMARIEEKFQTEMKPGSTAIIRDFPFPNLKPQEVFYMPKNHEIYIYRK